jgi:hypothetical protein
MISHSTTSDAEAQLASFIAKFDPSHQSLIHEVRSELQRRFPGAVELVYDNYNFFVIGYSPTERPSDAIISLTANASGVGLCFLYGATLPDPHGILRGSGNQTRSIKVPAVDALRTPAVRALIDAAEAAARAPFSESGAALVIRSVSAKQRPRKKGV